MTQERNDKSSKTAALNDELRHRLNPNHQHTGPDTLGLVVRTRGIVALPAQAQHAIIRAVALFDDFNPDNDPYGEHDFGRLYVEGAGQINWKIDYYENPQSHYGSKHPEDPARSHRVLTIMLAEEY